MPITSADFIRNPQEPTNQTSVKMPMSIAHTQANPTYDKKLSEAQQAQSLNNPFKAPKPHLQLIAQSAKLNRLINDPRYSGLKDEHKLMVLKQYYGKYTEPILKANGVVPPTFDEWARGQHAAYYDQEHKSKNSTTYDSYSVGVTEGVSNSLKFIKGAIKYTVGLGNPVLTRAADDPNNLINRAINHIDHVSQEYNSVFQVGATKSSWLANTTGNLVGESPAYIAVDAVTAGVGGVIPSLAERAALVPKFGKALKLAKEGGEIFTVDKFEGKDTRTATQDAILGPLLGLGFKVVGKGLKYGASKVGATVLDHINAKGTQLAVGGKPFANTVEHLADLQDLKEGKSLGEGQKLLEHGEEPKAKNTQSLVNHEDPNVKHIVFNERAMREDLASKYYPHKVTDNGKSVWRNLSTGQRAKIKEHINALTQISAETMPLTSPEVQTLANEHEIETWLKEAPENNALHDAIKQLTGLNPAEVLTEEQGNQVKSSFNLDTPTQHIDQAFNDSEEYEPLEGYASLKAGYQVSYKRNNPNLSPSQLSNSKAEDFINGSIKYLEDSPATKSGKIYFEHPEHHLLQVARNSSAPPSVKARATTLLKSEFGHNVETINKRSSWLKEHVDDLRRTGKLSSEGNIYRSTKLTQRRYGSKWQGELYNRDTLMSQQRELKALLRSNPELRGTIIPMLEDLIKFKNKASSGKKVGTRAAILDSVVNSLKGAN